MAPSGCFSGSPCAAGSPGGKHAATPARREEAEANRAAVPTRGGERPRGCRAHCTNRSAPGQVAAAAAPPFLRGKGRLQHSQAELRRSLSPASPGKAFGGRSVNASSVLTKPPWVTGIFQAAGTAQHRENSPSAPRSRTVGRDAEHACSRRRAPRFPKRQAPLSASCRAFGHGESRWRRVSQAGGGNAVFVSLSLPEGEITGHAAALRQTLTPTPKKTQTAAQKSLLWHFLIYIFFF